MFAQVHAGMRLCACVHVLRCGASCALAGRRFCCCCRRAGMPQPPENTPAHAPPPPLRRSWCRRGRGSLWLATAARPSASRCPRVRAGGVGWGGLRWLGGVLHQQASHTPHTPHKQASSSSWTGPCLRCEPASQLLEAPAHPSACPPMSHAPAQLQAPAVCSRGTAGTPPCTACPPWPRAASPSPCAGELAPCVGRRDAAGMQGALRGACPSVPAAYPRTQLPAHPPSPHPRRDPTNRVGPKHAPLVAREVERHQRERGPFDLEKFAV